MSNAPAESSPKAKVGLFDIRNIVGALLSLYGVILVLASFGTSDTQKAKAHGVNANLWVGLALLVVGVLMIVWAVTRPIVVDQEQLEADKRAIDEAARGPRDESGSAD
jgi:hypothetical protein